MRKFASVLVSYICLVRLSYPSSDHTKTRTTATQNRLYKGVIEDEDLLWQKPGREPNLTASITTLCGAGTSSLKQCMLIVTIIIQDKRHGTDGPVQHGVFGGNKRSV